MVYNSRTFLPCSYLARAAGAHLHTSESDEERQHLGHRHWGWGQHSPAVTENCHNSGEPKKNDDHSSPWCCYYITFYSMPTQRPEFACGFAFFIPDRWKHRSMCFVGSLRLEDWAVWGWACVLYSVDSRTSGRWNSWVGTLLSATGIHAAQRSLHCFRSGSRFLKQLRVVMLQNHGPLRASTATEVVLNEKKKKYWLVIAEEP